MISGRVVKKFVASTAGAVSAVLVTSSVAPAAQADVESTSNRVLQSVSVAMSPDGTLTGVDGSLVETSGSAEDAEAQASSYAPSDVATDLPVRVLTAWRTSEGAGTDLSDLQGYSGRVAIDLTVQNLTVEPQVLQYDVDGTSRSQAALVGSPLTITASAGLGDLAPATIVTDDEDTGRNVTNGVIGKSADGTTVQWAAMLAPPTLSSSAELSLVVDAKNFDVPEFDLSVQPGLVTDPSIGALVDSAFNPGSSEELELQSRTISLIGEVNAVLARASGTISDVRSNLTSSAATLGTQTVADLQSSTESVTGSMRSLDGALQSLQGDLSSTLESTGSSAVAELDQAVNAVDQMLGDTSAPVPTAQVDGNGCRATVAVPSGSPSIYGNLLKVAAQLKGYSVATGECQGALRDTILGTIGPEKPNEDLCAAGDESVTCTLFRAEGTFDGIAEALEDETDEALKKLSTDIYDDAVAEAEDVDAEVERIGTAASYIQNGRSGLLAALYGTADSLEEGGHFDDQVDELETSIGGIHADAGDIRVGLESMQLQTASAADALCEVKGDGTDGTLTAEKAEEIRSLLVATECPVDPETPGRPNGATDSLESRFGDRLDELAEIEGASNVEVADAGAAKELKELRARAASIAKQVRDALANASENNGGLTLTEVLDLLEDSFNDLEKQQGELAAAVQHLSDTHEQVATDVKEAIKTATDNASNQIGGAITPEIDKVHNAGVRAGEELGTMLQNSSDGLRSSADAVVRNGRVTLNTQKRDFAKAQAEAGNRISSEIEGGLSQINQGVSASTRDMEAATALLTADLRKVLLDLGTREVDGGGLLGAMATNAATARTADYQLALATNATTAYANVRRRDIDGIRLEQAQTDAALQMLADLPAFELDLPAGSVHRTVYSFRIGDGQ